MNIRPNTRKVYVGGLAIGGGSPVTVQSMTNTATADVDSTVAQIRRLEEAGCEIVRLAVPDIESARAVAEIKRKTSVPVVGDVHFDYRIALESIKNGVDKIRINPGNIGGRERIKEVAIAAKERGVPIRVGVNSGSLEKDILKRYGGATAEGLVESALRQAEILTGFGFYDIVISVKASDLWVTVEACRCLSKECEFPLHIGITEAGTLITGTVKSSIGISALLLEGIGDTLRVSLTGDPVNEVYAGIEILKAVNARGRGIELISCPTCGRCHIDLINLANEVEKRLSAIKTDKHIKVAVMGCEVNGPGEGREADVGVAAGRGKALFFKKGEAVCTIDEKDIVDKLIEETLRLVEQR